MRVALAFCVLFLFLVGCEKAVESDDKGDGSVSMPEASTPSGDVEMPDDVTK